ncbi:MAG TPA: hypothetical protein VFU86_19435 [Terriglobales bacterium]|nr:hypothetical protein [Terriglobales bacterium]
MLLDQSQPQPTPADQELNLLPPPGLNLPLWRSLLENLRDRISPERLPPLRLTSRSVDVGMLVGDVLDLPWYRTIFTNVGDVVSPETLPPLQLESHPVDVELVSDMPAWWRSLLRNLVDAVAPERQPALHLTSSPVNPEMASRVLMVPRWSSVIATPKVFLPDLPSVPRRRESVSPALVAAPLRTTLVLLPQLEEPAVDDFERQLVIRMQRSLRRSKLRELIWLSIIVTEVTALLVLRFM